MNIFVTLMGYRKWKGYFFSINFPLEMKELNFNFTFFYLDSQMVYFSTMGVAAIVKLKWNHKTFGCRYIFRDSNWSQNVCDQGGGLQGGSGISTHRLQTKQIVWNPPGPQSIRYLLLYNYMQKQCKFNVCLII